MERFSLIGLGVNTFVILWYRDTVLSVQRLNQLDGDIVEPIEESNNLVSLVPWRVNEMYSPVRQFFEGRPNQTKNQGLQTNGGLDFHEFLIIFSFSSAFRWLWQRYM